MVFKLLKYNQLTCYKKSFFAYQTITIFAPKQLINLIKKKTMKKTLLISAALLIGASSFAQVNRAAHKFTPTLRERNNQFLDASTTPAGNPNQPSTKVASHYNTSAACTFPFVTKAPNVLSVTGGVSNNCFTYNQDLNAISWTCRSGGWVFPGASSGTIKAVWSLNAGAAWDSMILYKDSNANLSSGGRYPGGALLNPKGNTNIANAWWLAAGPHVTTAFDGLFYSARKAAGTYHNPPNNKLKTLVIPGAGTTVFGNISNGTSCALDVDMQAVGTSKVMVTGPLLDPSYTTANGLKTSGSVIVKATAVSGSLVWSADSIKPPVYTDGIKATGTGYIYNGEGRLAFGPDSLIGYLVFEGVLAATAGNSSDKMMAPIVYKTTNGGTSWTLVLAGYDWMTEHPECMQNVCQGAILANWRPAGYQATHYSFYGNHGTDLTVDANGFLHYVTSVTDAFSDGASKDSLNYGYTPQYDYDYIDYHPIMWDFMTDGTCWKTMFIDSVMSAYMGTTPASDTTALSNQWYYNTGSTYFGYGAGMNVSRSVDGTKIFYGWTDSDFGTTGNHYNVQPDLFMKAFDVTTKKISGTTNLTNGSILCYFPRLSDISYYDNAQSKYVVPAMVTNGTILINSTPKPAWDGEKAVDFHYINCGTYGTADFANAATVNIGAGPAACMIGIKTNNTFMNSVNNYPNPFNNTTNIVVNLNTGKAIDLKVYDAIGKLVYTKNVNGTIGENTIVFDASTLNAGIYYYTVTAGFDRVTKKMAVQK